MSDIYNRIEALEDTSNAPEDWNLWIDELEDTMTQLQERVESIEVKVDKCVKIIALNLRE